MIHTVAYLTLHDMVAYLTPPLILNKRFEQVTITARIFGSTLIYSVSHSVHLFRNNTTKTSFNY
jgi:hypothetical protein